MIKKLAIILLLVGLFCYFIAAVTVLNKPKEGLVCNGVEVVVEDSLQTGFIQSGEVLRLLESRKCNPTGQKMDQVMLSRIEEALLVGMVLFVVNEANRVENQVIMQMVFIDVSCQNKLILAA